MTYFKIGNNDYSEYVNKLLIKETKVYNAQTNAAGDTVADYINRKRTIEVGIIPLNNTVLAALMADIDNLDVSLSFIDPKTNQLVENVKCIIPSSNINYYTIQADKILTRAFSLTFTEL